MATPVEKWIEEQARIFEPKSIYWCEGSEGEARRLIEMGMREEKISRNDIFRELNQTSWPKSYLHRSHPTDVARTEELTSLKSNSNMIRTLKAKNFYPTLFTNVALDEDRNEPWWEGLDGPIPESLQNRQGNPWNPSLRTT